MMQTQIQKAISAHNRGETLHDACLSFGVAISTVKYHMRKAKGGAVGNVVAHISIPSTFASYLQDAYPSTCLNRAIEMNLQAKNKTQWGAK